MPIKVAYLLGAGASEGVLKYGGALKSILMQSIQYSIAQKISEEEMIQLVDVSNDLVSGADIEHLITLYEASGTKRHNDIAKQLRGLFRQEIRKRINELGTSFFPNLFASLIDMHSISRLNEELVLILTTNYEDLLEKAMQQVSGGINYLIATICKDDNYSVNTNCFPVLKLHGSFNWRNEYPIAIQSEIEEEEDTLWIPPGVIKRRESYPFNVIWGRARELLKCDILRVIGSSLSRNDWELVALLYITQKLRTDNEAPYTIELIDYPSVCDKIKEQYCYLKIKTILEIDEVREYIIRTYLPRDLEKKEVAEDKIREVAKYITQDKENIFALWLRAKGEKLFYNDIPLTTPKRFFEQFIRSGLGATYE